MGADFVSASPEVSFCNAVTEIEVGPGANLDFVLCQRETSPTFHVSNLAARVDRDARLATHTLCLGGNLVRNDLQVRLVAEGAECRMNGLYLGTDRERIDNYTEVRHEAPHGTSAELYKGILAGSSHGVFRGRVIVAPDAQKTDARQQNPNLLLGAGAEKRPGQADYAAGVSAAFAPRERSSEPHFVLAEADRQIGV